MGIEGLGTKSVVGAHQPVVQALAADLDHVGYQVNRENVLGVYQVLANEALRLRKVVQDNGYKLEIGLCGGDPVSHDAQRGFNAKLDRLRSQCISYVASLANAAEQLKRAAQAYGYTEDEINASLTSVPASGATPNDLSPVLKEPPQASQPSLTPRLPVSDVGVVRK